MEHVKATMAQVLWEQGWNSHCFDCAGEATEAREDLDKQEPFAGGLLARDHGAGLGCGTGNRFPRPVACRSPSTGWLLARARLPEALPFTIGLLLVVNDSCGVSKANKDLPRRCLYGATS